MNDVVLHDVSYKKDFNKWLSARCLVIRQEIVTISLKAQKMKLLELIFVTVYIEGEIT